MRADVTAAWFEIGAGGGIVAAMERLRREALYAGGGRRRDFWGSMTPRRWNSSQVLYPNDPITSLGIIFSTEAAINCNKDQRKSHRWPRKQLLSR